MLDDKERLARAVAVANIPTLLMVLIQLTGDFEWMGERYRPKRTKGFDDNDTAGLPDAVQAEVRAAALRAIEAWRGGKAVALPEPSAVQVVQMLGFSMSDEVPAEYGPMFAEDVQTRPVALELESASKPHVPEGFLVAIVGAGASGICAAVHLANLGIEYVILERNPDIGGTWFENRYPGAGVDVPSHFYSYSFHPYDWPTYFALQDDVRKYLNDVADHFKLRDRIRPSSDVTAATFDEASQTWELQIRLPNGAYELLRANILITAVGAFNTPKIPSIPGLDTFEGSWFHTARWPDDVDLRGKRVAVVGTGASAMQVVPAIVDDVADVTIFQRSRQWAQPFPKFKKAVPSDIRYLFQAVPLYYSWYRLRLTWVFQDKLHKSLQKDPSWPHPERSLNKTNERHREYLTSYLRSELDDREDLINEALPEYPPFGKRMLMDNGWFRSLTRENVHLVTEPIKRVSGNQIITQTGASHEADVLVLATGFDAVHFVSSIEVRGRSGGTLQDAWNGDDGRAFLGLAIPDFPNLFTLYGPNTQTGHGGSLIYTVEAQVHYFLDLLTKMLEGGIGSVECRPEPYDSYAQRIDEANEAMIWTHPGMDTYYRNSRGRVVVVNPLPNLEFWRLTRHADMNDWITESSKSRQFPNGTTRRERQHFQAEQDDLTR
jgi:4-hydroxyacetophenone monooxygenase